MTPRRSTLGIGFVPVLLALLVLGLIGGGIGAMFYFKAKKITDAIMPGA